MPRRTELCLAVDVALVVQLLAETQSFLLVVLRTDLQDGISTGDGEEDCQDVPEARAPSALGPARCHCTLGKAMRNTEPEVAVLPIHTPGHLPEGCWPRGDIALASSYYEYCSTLFLPPPVV